MSALFLVGYPSSSPGRKRKGRSVFTPDDADHDDSDDDDYVELILVREADAGFAEMDTGPVGFVRLRPASADAWRSEPFDSLHSLLEDPLPDDESIGFAHNGFHVEPEERFSSIAEFFSASAFRSGAPDDRPVPRGQHYHLDDDAAGYGRHSSAE